jgi:hypothetical protein
MSPVVLVGIELKCRRHCCAHRQLSALILVHLKALLARSPSTRTSGSTRRLARCCLVHSHASMTSSHPGHTASGSQRCICTASQLSSSASICCHLSRLSPWSLTSRLPLHGVCLLRFQLLLLRFCICSQCGLSRADCSTGYPAVSTMPKRACDLCKAGGT